MGKQVTPYQKCRIEIEDKWRRVWRNTNSYKTGEDGAKACYCLDFFPYPSGSGLSVGHMRNYVPTDVFARYKRMKGYSVLHPMGWDAFGLPAENYALQQGVHPQETTKENVANYKRQMGLAELSYDWSREVNSTDPEYYKWTQWFFILLFNRGLAYQKDGWQWWCPSCKSVLANEQVVNGCCWRHEKNSVEKRAMRQWYFRITSYGDELLADLETVDWPEHIKKMQRQWIGRREGSEIVFQGNNPEKDGVVQIPVFTTRPDTLGGVTFLVIGPESPLVEEFTTKEHRGSVAAYVKEAMVKKEYERSFEDQSKSGVFTGSFARNPMTGRECPIWVGDFVISTYGTGAVMAVPSVDERDEAFAKTHGLPVVDIFKEDGRLMNSPPFDGLKSQEAIDEIVPWLTERGVGRKAVSYRMRDWLISRQRFWGAPIPMVHCTNCGVVPVPEEELPIRLPQLTVERMVPEGSGKSPLAACHDFVNTKCPKCGQEAKRETDTMDGFACSSWYFLRFTSPNNRSKAFDHQAASRWLPVDVYVGGAEHAVMHLLYARFWTKVFNDAGLIDFREPFAKLRNQGLMLAPDGAGMHKSSGNVVTPDAVHANWGTDCLRTYILFLGTFEKNVAWNEEGIAGVSRFLEKVWQLVNQNPGFGKNETAHVDLERQRHRAIKKVTEDIENFSFNTAISSLMEYRRYLWQEVARSNRVAQCESWHEAISTLLILLAPFAPFLAEELWERSGREGSVHQTPWPSFSPALAKEEQVTLPIRIDGKVRDEIVVPRDTSENEVKERVLARSRVKDYMDGRRLKRFFVVPSRIVCLDTDD